MKSNGFVYLLHFTKPYKGCTHYIGFSNKPYRRLLTHVKGEGNPLVKAAYDDGAQVLLVRMWEDVSKDFERQLKNRKKAASLCPCCNKNWHKNGKS